ncbi:MULTISPECIES: ATP-binding protein [Pseudomonas]|uniref:ATP-binding protein n=1 Tax=Pseudomonas TaxID=286 RepID=UPI000F0171B3|nr:MULTISPECIES: hypothetical protein [Pseudomonas]MBD8615198.1 hypothetical protein [Pseudomonas putida]MBD8682148.1 hypothetical protein [Pseudomonas sp. CFBP 13719]
MDIPGKNLSPKNFGLTRYALVNAGSHSLTVLPFWETLSIAGANNLGKSTILTSMQYILFPSGANSHNFGSHDPKESRQFYFPTTSSYLLMEVMLPAGSFILGAYGKGPGSGFDYDLFVCKGGLDTDDLLDNNRILSYRELFSRWGEAGREFFNVSREEMRQLLYGEYTKVKNGRFDVTLFPLANSTDKRYGTFRQIYKNLLTQTVLKSRDLKDLLLNVFEDKLSNLSINFSQVRREAFREYSLQAGEIKSLEARRADILSLHQENEARIEKRDEGAHLTRQLKVNAERAVVAYPAAIESRRQILAQVQTRKDGLTATYKANSQLMNELNRRKGQHDSLANELVALKQRVSLTTREQVQANRDAVQRELMQLESSLSQSSRFNADVLARQLENAKATLAQLQHQLKTLKEGDGLGHSLGLRDEEIAELSRILNPGLFSLPKVMLKEQTRGNFKAFLLANLLPENGIVERAGFKINLESLPALDFGLDKIPELELQISLQQQTVEGIEQNLRIALDQKGTQDKIVKLKADSRRLNGAVSDYDRLEDLEQQYMESKEQVVALELQIEDVMVAMADYATHLEAINSEASTATKEHEELNKQLQVIRDAQRQMTLRADFFGMSKGENDEFELDLNEVDFPAIVERLRGLEMGVRSIDLSIAASQQRILDELTQLSEHLEDGSLPRKAKEMLDALPEKRQWLSRLNDHAVIQVSSCLHDLSSNFLQLEHEVTLFNRMVNARKVSNIKRFSIELKRDEVVLESIDTLLKHLSNTEVNTADLFGGAAVDSVSDTELRRALDRLSRVVEDGRDGNLEVADLFELQFTMVDAKGKETVSEKLDQLASFGSTMTQKPLLYMNLLRHLADRKVRHEVFLPFYIDEANCIDTKNQETIISYCKDLGFTPVFASVHPTLSASLGVNLSECLMDDNRIVITEKDWQFFNHEQPQPAEDQLEMLS